jgi:hypothetical protein
MDYLVHYGLGAFLGRFRSEATLMRNQRVILQTPRGLELGTVLETAAATSEKLGPLGIVLRAATSNDEFQAQQHRRTINALLDDAQTLALERQLPLTFLDAEVLFDGNTAILQAIHWDECNADELFAELSQRHQMTVTLHDLTTKPAPEESGCSSCGSEKGGCSSCGTGGGCSTGSCSSGAVKSSAEMTDYFAGLRQQMEAAKYRVPLH